MLNTLKAYYKAHGANATWEWLEMIAPTVEVLRKLSRMFNDILGSDQGTRHAPPELTEDIQTLMASLDEHGVYKLQKGRVLGDGEQPAKDVIEIGFHALSQGPKNPLHEYNMAFKRLQTRRSMNPVTSSNIGTRTSQPLETATVPVPAPSSSLASPSFPISPNATYNQELVFPEAINEEEHDSTELDQLLEDIEGGVVEPTFSRLTEADIAFDMDNVVTVADDGENDETDSEAEDDVEEEEQECLVDVEYRDL